MSGTQGFHKKRHSSVCPESLYGPAPQPPLAGPLPAAPQALEGMAPEARIPQRTLPGGAA